jgi:superfamily II DNA or RNA helicase
MDLKRKALLLEAIAGCTSWDDIHAKWTGLSEIDKGARFEDLTQAFLRTHETYAKEFVNIWRPEDAPAEVVKKLRLRVPEWGVDLVGETRSGEYWSIQCKYRQDTDQELTHNDISSSVATTFESSRGFSYLLVCTTTQRVTNHYDHNPKVLFYGLPMWQQIDAAFLDTLRSKLAGKKVALTPYSPRKHQINAIQDGLKHFKEGKATRGKLIMPCGTGKSLTAWFLSQALGSKRIVIAVPSLSLVKQTLGVWTREAYHNNVDVKWLCVCSDETAGRAEQDDIAVKVKDLGVPCHTSPDAIARELQNNEHNLTVVFTTYQSGQVLATAARKAKYAFDLGIMDEAHKTVGDGDKLFSHLIHDHNIEIRQRVFMTATERRFSGSSDKILSMDDPEVYGETFHLLTFKKAMEAVEGERPILCDYNVITIGVSRDEVKELIQKNLFVRPDSGKWDEEMEADMLAAMVALRKAMKEYPIKHAVSFHGSIKRAEQFREYNDSFTEEFPSFGQLSTFHVSGQTPTGTRSNIIKQFALADRALVTNARCLTEGVDVPSIDCVLFADPKKSKVDIVQAVGRALRPAQGKKLGYVILPVLHDEESGELKESGAFKEVIDMLANLASQDERIIDEFRAIYEGQKSGNSNRVHFEFGERISANIDLAEFTGELQIKCWSRLAKLSWRPFIKAREFAQSLGLGSSSEWKEYCDNLIKREIALPPDIPKAPDQMYKEKGWNGWGDFLGTGYIATFNRAYRPFEAARTFVRSLNLKSVAEWHKFMKGQIEGLPPFPDDIPANPDRGYKDSGWIGFGDWLGTGTVASFEREYLPYAEAREFVVKLGLKSSEEWSQYCKGLLPQIGTIPSNIPKTPSVVYKDEGWCGLGEWLGTGTIAPFNKVYRNFSEARAFARSLNLGNFEEWRNYCAGNLPDKVRLPDDIPKVPSSTYDGKGWISWADWLGTRPGSLGRGNYMRFEEAREYVRSRKFTGQSAFLVACKKRKGGGDPMPFTIPTNPNIAYKKSGWSSWGDWLGTGVVSTYTRQYRSFGDARSFARSLKIASSTEWNLYTKGQLSGFLPLPADIPAVPRNVYKGKGWVSFGDWLGTGTIAPSDREYRGFDEARDFARKLELKTQKDWEAYCRGEFSNKPPLPTDIPSTPRWVYKEAGWAGIGDWLGTGKIADQNREYIPIEDAKVFVRALGLKSQKEWVAYTHGEIPGLPALPHNIPANPQSTYKQSGWMGMADWIGAGRTLLKNRSLLSFKEAKKYVHKLSFKKQSEWYAFASTDTFPSFLPRDPHKFYLDSGWKSWGDWLGTGFIAPVNRQFLAFNLARSFARGLKLKSVQEWRKHSKAAKSGAAKFPDNVPKNPDQKYLNSGWISWSDWLGNEVTPRKKRKKSR